MIRQSGPGDFSREANKFVKDYYQAFYDTHERSPPELPSTGHKFVIPEQFGDGVFHVRKMRDATFSSSDIYFGEDVCITEELRKDVYFLAATLDNCTFTDMDRTSNSLQFNRQVLNLCHSNVSGSFQTTMTAKERVRSISFAFTEQQIQQYLLDLNRADVMDDSSKTDGMRIIQQSILSDKHQHLIHQLQNNPYQGQLEQLFFECKSGELLIAMLDSIFSDTPQPNVVLSERDRELLRLAKKLLLQDPQNPPTIAKLARKVGLNENKLKKGFKSYFNNTIFKTLTEYRMSQALEKLKRSDMSITEIAFDTGYDNVSKFIAVFKKTYGKTPGMMRKQVAYYLANN